MPDSGTVHTSDVIADNETMPMRWDGRSETTIMWSTILKMNVLASLDEVKVIDGKVDS